MAFCKQNEVMVADSLQIVFTVPILHLQFVLYDLA